MGPPELLVNVVTESDLKDKLLSSWDESCCDSLSGTVKGGQPPPSQERG